MLRSLLFVSCAVFGLCAHCAAQVAARDRFVIELRLARTSPAAGYTQRESVSDSSLFVNDTVLVSDPDIENAQAERTADADGRPVLGTFLEKLPATAELALVALVFAVVLGIPLGYLAARHRGSPLDTLVVSGSLVGVVTPVFFLAILLKLVFAGWLILRRALDEPSWPRLIPVSIISGLLLLTHYWSIYLVAAVVLALGWSWRGARHRRAGRVIVAVVLGGVLFIPWLPGFLDQAQNTGTPWGRPERPTAVVMVSLQDFGGIPSPEGEMAGTGIALLTAVRVARRIPTAPPARR